VIMGERKPLSEIREMLKGYKKVLVLGCRTCVAVCMAGGDKEVELLGSQLRIASKKDGDDLEILEDAVERQCDVEYIEPLKEKVAQVDAVLSMACGCGVQFMAELYSDKPVLPAINTDFIGVTEKTGVWTSAAIACSISPAEYARLPDARNRFSMGRAAVPMMASARSAPTSPAGGS
jgi:hypothetical protein